MPRGIEIFGGVELDRRHRIVEYEARAADQRPMTVIVDRAVILEVVEEAAGRVDCTRMVKRHGLRDVIAQKCFGMEVGQGRHRVHAWSSMKASTSPSFGIAAKEPWRVTVSAPHAAA